MKNTPYTFRYNAIPISMIGKKILEVGCGTNIFESNLANKLSQVESYRCIDPAKTISGYSIVGDITKMDITEKYDTILMIEVLEHIHLRNWIGVVSKLRNALRNQGNLIISVPARQQLADYLMYWNTDYWEIHTVFGITKDALMRIFPDSEIKYIRHTVFRHDGKSILWATGRLIKRKILKSYPVLRQSYLLFWKQID